MRTSDKPDPADELRDLIREAHGAVKDLTGLLRELRGLRAAIPAEVKKYLEITLNAHIGEVNSILNEGTAVTQRLIKRQERQTRDHYRELLGSDGRDLILRTCGMILHLSVPTITVDKWIEQFTAAAEEHKVTGCNCLGCVTAAPDDGGGRVYVVTDPADAPPDTDVIFDLRDKRP